MESQSKHIAEEYLSLPEQSGVTESNAVPGLNTRQFLSKYGIPSTLRALEQNINTTKESANYLSHYGTVLYHYARDLHNDGSAAQYYKEALNLHMRAAVEKRGVSEQNAAVVFDCLIHMQEEDIPDIFFIQ